jgi:hypothetical protein
MRSGCILIFMLLGFLVNAQCNRDSSATMIDTERGTTVNLKKFGKSTIYLKDGSAKKNCHIIEIKAESIVYLKQKVLHDLLIDKIKRIDSDESNMIIQFTDEKKPLIRYPLYNYND